MEKIKNQMPVLAHFLKTKKIDLIFLLGAVLLGVYFQWAVVEIAIFAFFIWSLVNSLPSRYLAWATLGLIIFTALFLMSGRESDAEKAAIYAYYFLVMTVVQASLELWQEKRSNDGRERRTESNEI